MTTFTPLGVVLLSLASASMALGQVPPDLRSKIREGWLELARLDGMRHSHQAHRDGTRYDFDRNATPLDTSSRFRIDDDESYRLVRSLKGQEDGMVVVGVWNPQYSFMLTRKQGESWRLLKVVVGKKDPPALSSVFLSDFNRPLFYPLSTDAWGEPLVQLIGNKRFELTKSEQLPGDKLKVSFQYAKLYAMLGNKPVPYTGYAILNTKLHYAAEKWEHALTSGKSPIPTIIERDLAANGAGVRCNSIKVMSYESKQTITFDEYSTAPFDKSEFRLSHYGLSEPIDVPPPPYSTPLYVWLLLAGVAVLVIGALLRFFLKRRSAASA